MGESREKWAIPPRHAGLTGPAAQAVGQIAAAFAARDTTTADEIVALSARLASVFTGTSAPATLAAEGEVVLSVKTNAPNPESQSPAIPVENAVSEDKVFCLCCGRGFTMLKRHLKAEHGLSEEEYRALYNLPEEMTLVAPNYSARKAAYAKRVGLGKYNRDQTAQERAAAG